MYIGAVGTKIFQFDTELGELVEDVKWSQALDTEWDLELVERAAADVIQKAGGDSCHLYVRCARVTVQTVANLFCAVQVSCAVVKAITSVPLR